MQYLLFQITKTPHLHSLPSINQKNKPNSFRPLKPVNYSQLLKVQHCFKWGVLVTCVVGLDIRNNAAKLERRREEEIKHAP